MNGLTRIPVAPFEHYMLCDDSARYSMTCHTRFWFAGEFDYRYFSEALRDAFAHHPLMSAHLVGDIKGKTNALAWEFQPFDPKYSLDWQGVEQPLDLQPQPLSDLRSRVIVRVGKGQSLLIVQFHHAICDGMGAFRFVEDLLTAYAARYRGELPQLQPLQTAALSARLHLHLTPRAWWWRLAKDCRRMGRFFRCIPKTLAVAPLPLQPLAKAELSAAVRVVLSEEETKRLQSRAKSQDVSLNDFILCHLFALLGEWNYRHQGKRGVGTFRIAVPTSLRLPADDIMSAANLVGMVFLDQRWRPYQGDANILAKIRREMTHVKQDRMGLTLLRILGWFGAMPHAMRTFMRVPICQTTAVLTNLGRPFLASPLTDPNGVLKAGNVTLTGLDTLPPLRPLTPISWSVNGYNDQFSITLRYDSTVMTAATAHKLVDAYVKNLRSAGAPQGVLAQTKNSLSASSERSEIKPIISY